MAYDPVSKTGGRKAVRVQLPPSAPFSSISPKTLAYEYEKVYFRGLLRGCFVLSRAR